MSLELIIARQHELRAVAEAEAAKTKARQERAEQAFRDTGIPEMWEQIKDTLVPHWRGNDEEREQNKIPLHAHVQDLAPTSISFLDHNGNMRARWWVTITQHDDLRFNYADKTSEKHWIVADDVRAHFVDAMAKWLPPLDETVTT